MADEDVTLIYLLSEMDGTPRYIGKTRQSLAARVRGHRNGRKLPVSRWIRKREGRILVDVLEEATDSTWSKREAFWIETFREMGCPLLNLLNGGEGAHRPVFSPEHRAKIGAALRTGRDRPCEWCGSSFWAKPSHEAKGHDRFCSRECSSRFGGALRKGKPQPVVWAAVEAAATLRRARTHCKRGHEFTPENTYVWSGKRICRVCARAKTKAHRLRKKAADATALKLRIDGSVNGR